MHHVVVYPLLDEFKAYDLKLVVKGTPNSFCVYGDEVQQIRDHSGWSVWSYPHPEHWELPPIHDMDGGIRGLKFLNVNFKHWERDTGANGG